MRILAAPTDHRPVRPERRLPGRARRPRGGDRRRHGAVRRARPRCARAPTPLVHTVIRADQVRAIPVPRLQDILDYHSSVEQAAQTAARNGVGTLVLTHYVPPMQPGAEDEWRAIAAEHFDGPDRAGRRPPQPCAIAALAWTACAGTSPPCEASSPRPPPRRSRPPPASTCARSAACRRPRTRTEAAFEKAVRRITLATEELLAQLPPRQQPPHDAPAAAADRRPGSRSGTGAVAGTGVAVARRAQHERGAPTRAHTPTSSRCTTRRQPAVPVVGLPQQVLALGLERHRPCRPPGSPARRSSGSAGR